MAYPSTNEAVRTLTLFNSGIAARTAATTYLQNDPLGNTENLSRRIVLGALTAQNTSILVSELMSREALRGGVGEFTDYDTTLLDTAYALEALAQVGQIRSTVAQRAIAYVKQQQNQDGGWPLNNGGNDSSISVTALMLKSLAAYRTDYSLDSSVSNAVNYLLSKRDSNGLWPETYQSALSLIALIHNLDTLSSIQGSLLALSSQQAYLGSWDEDVYTTSLVLRALFRSSNQPVYPRYGTVFGRVINSTNGQPLLGATVTLSGLKTVSLLTAADGQFYFSGLVPGQYTLQVAIAGFSTLTGTATFYGGDSVNFGSLQMVPQGNATNAVAQGTILDSETGLPLPGVAVSISVAGGATYSAITDSKGLFLINNLVPGEASFNASLAGYYSVATTATLIAGQTITFNPGLTQKPQPVPIAITGQVIDANTSTLLSGASIQILNSSYITQSDVNGGFQLSGIPSGVVTIEVIKTGYIPAVYTISAPAGGAINLGTISLLPGTATGTTGTITGVMTDALTGASLRGVQITISGSDSKTGYTGSDGRFSLSGVNPGNVVLTATLTDYHDAVGNAEIKAGTTLQFNGALVKAENAALVTIFGTVIDKNTQQPLTGVTVTAGNSLTTQTAVGGGFYISGIKPGDFNVTFNLAGYNPVVLKINAKGGNVIDLTGIGLLSDIVSSNRAPVITSRAPPQAVTAYVYEYKVSATDADGDTLTYALSEFPAGMEINSSTGVIRWIPTSNQIGNQVFNLVVSDNSGAIALENVSVAVSSGGNPIYVVTDVQTLNGFTKDALIPDSYILGSYVSGGRPETWKSPSPDGCGFYYIGGGTDQASIQQAANTLDYWSMGSGYGSDAIWDLGSGFSSVSILPFIDHVPFPQEGIEYTIWGSNDPNAPFPDGWSMATLVTIYTQGWADNRAQCTQSINIDDYAGLYTFGNVELQYIRLKADYSISIFNTPEHNSWSNSFDDSGLPGWQSVESEIDGVAGMICNIKPIANAGQDIVGKTRQAIQFDGSSSQGNIVTYGWDLDGDSVIDLNGAMPSHTFNAGFDQDVSLLVVNDKGCVGTDTVRVTITLDIPKPDLIVNDISTSEINTNLQTLSISGNATVSISNIGQVAAVNQALVTLFEDTNNNGKFDSAIDNILSSQTLPKGLAIGELISVDMPVYGVVSFRDTPIYAMVDSDGKIDELDETNNTNISNRQCGQLVDLTTSAITVIDNGSGQASISARIGNGGGGDLSQEIAIAFYQGDPASGGTLLGIVPINNMAAGSSQNVILKNVTALSGLADIYVIADYDNRLMECNEANNQTLLPVLPQTTDGFIGVATDAPVYGPNSPIQLQASVTNISAIPGEFRSELRVEDVTGAVIQNYPQLSTGVLAGGASINLSELWNTAVFQVGTYQLHGLLYSLDGALINEATSLFEIRHSIGNLPLAALRTTTDRPVYNTSDTAQLENLARNLYVNALIKGAGLRISVSDPSGTEVFTSTQELGELAGGALRETITPYSFVNAIEGTYTVNGLLIDSNGNTLATDQTQFEVMDDLLKSLTGIVTAQSKTLDRGQSQVCTDSLAYTGNQTLAAQPIRQLLVRLDIAELVTSIDVTVTLASGATDSLMRSITTGSLNEGVYSCVLQAQIAGNWIPLANDNFTVTEPPIRITGDLGLGSRGRVLILLDDGLCKADSDDFDSSDSGDHTDDEDHDDKSDEDAHDSDDDSDHGDSTKQCGSDDGHDDSNHDSDEGHDSSKDSGHDSGDDHDSFACSCLSADPLALGPNPIPGLVNQRTYLENLLTMAGWSYTITTKADDFTREFRSGGYSTYLLLSENTELSEQVQDELVEASFRGDGLIEAGSHDQRQEDIDEALGIKYRGKHANMSGVFLSQSVLQDEAIANFLLNDKTLRANTTSSQTVARFLDNVGGLTTEPAVTINQHGEGLTVYGGFDLLAEATLAGPPDNIYGKLILNALDYVNPVIAAYNGSVIPLRIQLSNEGNATPGRVQLPMPDGVTVVDAGEAILIDTPPNPVTLEWPFDLAVGDVASFTSWLQLPPSTLNILFEATVQVGSAPDYTDHTVLSEELPLLALPTIAEVQLTLSGLDSKTYKKVIKNFNKAAASITANDIDKALKFLVKAADELKELNTTEAMSLRLLVDGVLRRTAMRWTTGDTSP